jgi:Cu(I)/Ag(I) efflux system membrane fusion protein
MRNLLKSNISFLLAAVVMLAAACKSSNQQAEADSYFCPMHPTVESLTPGVCPVCNMELVARSASGSNEALTAEELEAAISPSEKIAGTTATIRGEYTEKNRIVRANGVVSYDARSVRTVTTRVAGRIESVEQTSPYQQVTKGRVLATIYSAELQEAQRSFIQTLSNSTPDVIEASRNRLILLGLTAEMVRDLEKNKTPFRTLEITSPVSGFLITESADKAESAAGTSSGMMNEQTSSIKPLANTASLKKGDYAGSGQVLFTILEKGRYRLDLSVRDADLIYVKPGQTVNAVTASGKKVSGTISLVESTGREGANFRLARVYIAGEALTIGMPLSAEIETGTEEGLWLPESAVMENGAGSIVFVKREKYFVPRVVVTGNRSNGKLKIIKGLATSDEVAVSAGLLVDSDAIVRTRVSEESEVTFAEQKVDSESASDALMLDNRAIALAGIKTAPAVLKQISSQLQLNGKVVNSPEQRSVISARFPGRIETLNFRETGKYIRAGTVIAEIHSPEILTIISELRLTAGRENKNEKTMAENRLKLQQYGFEKHEIDAWISAAVMPQNITIKSAFSGTITEVNASPGKMVDEGSPLITIENLENLRVEAEIYPGTEELIRQGSRVQVTLPGTGMTAVTGITEQILPSYGEGRQSLTGRIRIPNTGGNFRPGQSVRITAESRKYEAVVVPSESIIETKNNKMIFLRTGLNSFEARNVITGISQHGYTEITEGIPEGVQVVTSGAYLLSGQLKLRPAGTSHH